MFFSIRATAATLSSNEVPGGRSTMTWNSPRSSTGTNSVPMTERLVRLVRKTTVATASVDHGWPSAQPSTTWYFRSSASYARPQESNIRPARVLRRSSGGMNRTNLDESIGSRVKATSSDIVTAKAIVRANDLKNCPTMPVMKPTGRKTARMVKVVAITARPISEVPRWAAVIGSAPCSMWR